MIKKIIITIFLFSATDSFAQNKDEKPESPFWSKVFVGGNLGAQFGNITFVDISPIVGYRFTEKISAGFGITYRYYSVRSFNYETHIYGGRLFARYQPLNFLFLHAEYEMLNWNCPRMEPTGFTTERLWSPGLMAGGGFSQPLVGGSSIFIMGLYNFLHNDCSPYANPFILRIGANFGL